VTVEVPSEVNAASRLAQQSVAKPASKLDVDVVYVVARRFKAACRSARA
jgi:hypothetical protein